MSSLQKYLELAFPHVPADLAAAAAAELLAQRPDGYVSPDKYREAVEKNEMYLDEIGRLNTEIVRHKDGVKNATRAGLDVLGERARQRRLEGYDDDHDDGLTDFSLSAAAIAYAMDARLRATTGQGFDRQPPMEWPWSPGDWKPKKVRHSLVVAAALLIAEIERMDRNGDSR